jgi:carbonic anhydrase
MSVRAGKQAHIRHLSINGLLPPTEHYMTYEGSLTQPGCQETVTWIIINKPIYISNSHVSIALIDYSDFTHSARLSA